VIFSLEALNAQQGDCFLLHFGTAKQPRMIVIDGGPQGVFDASLKPKLDEIRKQRGIKAGSALPTDLLMVSHIDDDHIHGILDWFTAMTASPGAWKIRECWFNSFEDVLNHAPKIRAAALKPAEDSAAKRSEEPAASHPMIAYSVSQGRGLRDDLKQQKIRVNDGKPLLFAPSSTPHFEKAGVKLTLVAPNKQAVDRLQKTWEITPARALALDNAVENLSSLVVMAECGARRILLTGDARGDYILDGLKGAGYLKNGTCKVDILKLPHHGSSRNCTQELFEKVPAAHYVISANGMYDNPDAETLCLMAKVLGENGDFTLHLTNAPNAKAKTGQGKSLYANVQKALTQYPWLAKKMAYGPTRINLLD
jgi:hypothetical protein